MKLHRQLVKVYCYGVLDYWSTGLVLLIFHYSITPVLQYHINPTLYNL